MSDEQSVLDERARALAAPVVTTDVRTDAEHALVEIRASVGRYAVALSQVREVVRCPALMGLPGAPPQFVGVARVRGRLVTVIELAALFGRAARPPLHTTEPRWVVVCGPPDDELGLLAEGVYAETLTDEMVPLDGAESSIVKGTLPSGTLLVDVEALLNDPRTTANQSIAGNPP